MDEVTDGQAPEPVNLDAPVAPEPTEVETQQPEATAGTDDDGADDTANVEQPKPAKGVQKRLDELTRAKHEERRDKEYWRDLALSLQTGNRAPESHPQASPTDRPKESDYQDYDAYQEALVDWKVGERLSVERQRSQMETVAQTFNQRQEAARAKFADYDDVVGDRTLPISPVMAEVIRDSDIGPEVAYHLGQNRSEAARIASLPPHRQAVELGKIEVALTTKDEPKATPRTPPPAPPKTVSGLSAGLNKSAGEMTMAEYVAARSAGKI